MLVVKFLDASDGNMKMQPNRHIKFVVCATAMSSLSACGWVDSTGTQLADFTGTAGLLNAQPILVIEETTVEASLIGEGSTLDNWNWTLKGDDARSSCHGMNGFDANVAETSLADACANGGTCAITLEEINSDSGTQFSINVPTLKAPVALSYNLTAVRDDGATVRREQVLCAVSVNEAPVAEDDTYTVRIDSAKIVDGGDIDNLLSNDSDDNDVRNSALRVITTPVTRPKYASQFQLESDGGFTYVASPTAPLNDTSFLDDTFTYSVTDGLYTVDAQATIKIIDSNEPPVQLLQLPDVVLTSDNGLDESHKRTLNIAQHFADPDGDELTFSSDELPQEALVALTADGFLNSDASSKEVKQQRVLINVTDGKESISGSFVLTIRLPVSIKDTEINATPSVTDIKNHVFSGEFTYDVSPFFSDKDAEDLLTYTATNLPAGLQIRADGVIEGEVDSSNKGRWFIVVTADDGYGGTVDDGFLLVLN
ncbi:MAG: Ig-like domain-containing protein [Granulosicoccus sp.]